MRRAWVVLLLALAPAAPAAADEQGAARELARVRDDPARLAAFLRPFPKGADLHMHLAGAVYAEDLIGFAASDGDCVDAASVSSPAPCAPGDRPASDAATDRGLHESLVRAWSMEGFAPGATSAHDHFFATFARFAAALQGREGDALATVVRRARAQRVQLLEVLHTVRFAEVAALANRVPYTRTLPVLRRRLLAAGLRDVVRRAGRDVDALLAQERRADPRRGPLVRLHAQVLRAMPPAVVFAQMVLGFELMRADRRWAAINLVQPEDDPVALRDYDSHMRMLRHLRGVYRRDRITLHAGELVPGLVPRRHLRFHIRSAIRVAGARRIGHGVDVRHERRPLALLREMARRRILVEVPLVSNCQVLGVCGPRHPLGLYRRFGVPVALATDDEGVSRTSLTEQFALAVQVHGLGYGALKRLARDSLRHAFVPARTKERLLRRHARALARFEAGHGR